MSFPYFDLDDERTGILLDLCPTDHHYFVRQKAAKAAATSFLLSGTTFVSGDGPSPGSTSRPAIPARLLVLRT
jgi:hypothetical protein